MLSRVIDSLTNDREVVWLNPLPTVTTENPELLAAVEIARARFRRFETILAELFPTGCPDGVISSRLLGYPGAVGALPCLFVKADHELPISGSVKARGGVSEFLGFVERIAKEGGLTSPDGDLGAYLTSPEGRAALQTCRVVVASTGNLGLAIGTVARAFGIAAEIHMSADAKSWKKAALRAAGAEIIEYAGDYGEAVRHARMSAQRQPKTHFIDDERSTDLFVGYATAARELADQIEFAGISVTAETPLTIYLPCGVGGAPGGILFGLRAIYGDALRAVFVEPIASASMLIALEQGDDVPRSVYEFGLNNQTVADGLAVARASETVVELVGHSIDACVALRDETMIRWVARAHREAGLRLEPSAAAALAAIEPYLAQAGRQAARGTHVAWTTGGAMLPDDQFDAFLRSAEQQEARATLERLS